MAMVYAMIKSIKTVSSICLIPAIMESAFI